MNNDAALKLFGLVGLAVLLSVLGGLVAKDAGKLLSKIKPGLSPADGALLFGLGVGVTGHVVATKLPNA